MEFNGKALYFVAVKVFLRKGNELLLTHDIFGSWDLPGGRIKPDEFDVPIESIVDRKIREELGDKVQYKLIGATDTFFRVKRQEVTANNQQVQIFAVSFEAEYLSGEIKLGEHHDEFKWVDIKSFEPERLFEGGWLLGVQDYITKVNNSKGGASMKLVIVYKETSEQRLSVESFIRDFKFQTGGDIETIDPETREGEAFCRTYDVVEYPTMLALADDGTPAMTWRGILPTISDASGYK